MYVYTYIYKYILYVYIDFLEHIPSLLQYMIQACNHLI